MLHFKAKMGWVIARSTKVDSAKTKLPFKRDVCRGGLKKEGVKKKFGSTEREPHMRHVPPSSEIGGLDELLGAWTSCWGLGLVIWTLDKKSGPWIRNLEPWTSTLGPWTSNWDLGEVIWGLD